MYALFILQTSWVWMPRKYTYFKCEILLLSQIAHISAIDHTKGDVWAHFSACTKRNKRVKFSSHC